MSTPTQLMDEYAVRTNIHRFDNVAELIAEDAIFIFSDGTFRGLQAIRKAFEETWSYIRDEIYGIDNLQWLAVDDQIAVCIYNFHWQGLVSRPDPCVGARYQRFEKNK